MSRWIPGKFRAHSGQSFFDAAIIGGGHNGLVAAAYLAKGGKRVAVLERRHVLGGAAVTEEIIPGFKFSRASYLLSLLRPQIVQDLELKKHGLKVHLRNPSHYTPSLKSGKSLLLGNDMRENERQIAKFSKADAQAYGKYEEWMNKVAEAIDPLLDCDPVDVNKIFNGPFSERLLGLAALGPLTKTGTKLGASEVHSFYELITAPASKILDRWFESEHLKATLATDGVIGAMISPKMSGSGYVLLHHVMGELEGVRNAWGYVHGGNGALSMAIAEAARSYGAEIFIDSPVTSIQTRMCEDSSGEKKRRACGVVLEDGTEITAKAVLSNATPKVTYFDLLPEGTLSGNLEKELRGIDYTSPVTKINVALRGLPSFSADPSPSSGPAAPHHQCTIHLNTETVDSLHTAYLEAQQGVWSNRPMLEVCIPSSLDDSLAPPGCHVMSIFSQYTPYKLRGERWTEDNKDEYANHVFGWIDAYAPGFKELVVGYDVLTPQDLESIFGLTGGNIFHGAMSLDQLYLSRPTPRNVGYASRGVEGLYLCGSGAHPGGGIMGSPGRLAAINALWSL